MTLSRCQEAQILENRRGHICQFTLHKGRRGLWTAFSHHPINGIN